MFGSFYEKCIIIQAADFDFKQVTTNCEPVYVPYYPNFVREVANVGRTVQNLESTVEGKEKAVANSSKGTKVNAKAVLDVATLLRTANVCIVVTKSVLAPNVRICITFGAVGTAETTVANFSIDANAAVGSILLNVETFQIFKGSVTIAFKINLKEVTSLIIQVLTGIVGVNVIRVVRIVKVRIGKVYLKGAEEKIFAAFIVRDKAGTADRTVKAIVLFLQKEEKIVTVYGNGEGSGGTTSVETVVDFFVAIDIVVIKV